MNNFIQNYEIILKQLQKLNVNPNIFIQIRKPKLSNLALVALNLTAEYMGIDSECQLFRVIQGSNMNDLIERSVYNRRKRKLFPLIEQMRQKLANYFNEHENYYLVDSMPLEVCKNSRASRSRICKEQLHSSPDKGFCASQKMYYYGYKLHSICSVKGVFQSLDITPASVHDIKYIEEIKNQLSGCTLIGDRGYISAEIQLDLFQTVKINLQTPMRKNQFNYQKQTYIFRKSRKRIETLFSQLCDQFMMRRNYAKSFDGFRTRILSKIAALTLIQYINKFVFDRPVNNIKINLA